MLRGTRLWGLLAVISIIVLLLSFERVVQQAVRQGDLRRAAVLDQTNAAWRCAAMPGRQARDDCRLALLALR